MANDFFNDTLPSFVGIDIGWDQDPNFPIGDYSVVQDAADSTNRQFTLSQTEDDNVALSEGVLMITGPATSGFDADLDAQGKFSGRASWHQIGTEFAKLDGDDNPLLAKDIDGNELTLGIGEYGFWITFESQDMFTDIASPYASVGRLVIEQISDTIRFIGSDTYTKDTDAVNFVDELGQGNGFRYPVIFLGSAEVEFVEGEKVATFTQFTFGPLTIPAITYLDGLISTDSKTLLMEGEDRGITTSPIAADSDNDIINTDSGQVKLKIGSITGGHIVIERADENDGKPKIGVEDGAFAEPPTAFNNDTHQHPAP
ncbi:MAG: hypothetical protein CL438_09170 [Acidimicrobiaceae bacterium]|nr:hypothetical protein [Acidimicrobiaceae bacterium]|tara:strand:+ start:484 stop:1425 length:942 start_codon:yes stop_codon:yes gene_type:complete